MRSLVILACVLAASRASADSFTIINAGLAVPISDSDWTRLADPSLKLGVRAGGGRPDVAGYVSFDFTPVSFVDEPGFGDLSAQRYRALVGIQVWRQLVPNVHFDARLGVGIDIAHASYTFTVLGTTTKYSDTDVGYAFEPAAGLWFDIGATANVGFELGFPVGHHDKTAMPGTGDFTFKYTSVDLDLMGGIRVGL
jgi:hypothetical protein